MLNNFISLLALTAALSSAQKVIMWDQPDCQGIPSPEMSCGDYYEKCSTTGYPIFSYQITDDEGQFCPSGGKSVYNTWYFFYNENDCDGANAVADSGGAAGCAPNGCINIEQPNGTPTDAYGYECKHDFSCGFDCEK